MSTSRTTWVAWSLVLLGLVLSALLLSRSLALASSDASGGIDICGAVFGGGCDEALRDQGNAFLGIPLAGWGVVLYVVLAALLGMEWFVGSAIARPARTCAAATALAGAVLGLILSATMLLGAKPLCPTCIVVHGISVALAFVLWRRRSAPLPVDANPPPWTMIGMLCVLLIAALTHQWILLAGHLGAVTPTDVSSTLRRFDATTPVDMEIRADDPRIGSPAAPAQVVVFSSLECPGCRQLLEALSDIRGKTGEDVSIVLKHYPLSSVCNPGVEADQHPHSCAAALAAEAARLQGRFWAFHDAVHAQGFEAGEGALEAIAISVGLDMDLFRRQIEDPALAARLAADVELGNRLEIPGTPALFVNGRQVHDLRIDAIEAVIDHACAK